MDHPRTAFFGTPEFALPTLVALSKLTNLVGVVCQPDRRSGRGMRLAPPAVKRKATELGIPVLQPTKVRDGSLEEWLRRQSVVAAVVVAYGRILPPGVLRVPERGCINLHASVLPAYRGAAPIQWSLMDGRSETGVSLMQMEAGMDTGPVFSVSRTAIEPETNAGELSARLAQLAAELLERDLSGILTGRLKAQAQRHDDATSAPPIEREHQLIDWQRPARAIHDQVRALAPRPGAITSLEGRRMKVFETRASDEPSGAPPGTVVDIAGGRVIVACGEGRLQPLRAQLEGRPVREARDLVNARVFSVGSRFAQREAMDA